MKTIKILAGLIVVLVILSITFSNHSLEYSGVVTDLTHDITSLEHANTILSAEIAQRGSLTLAASELAYGNYTEPDAIATLNRPDQIALR